jgi:hypothetical protein
MDFGIRYQSPFNNGTFLVVDRLPPDIMRDLLEGVVPFEMALVLQQLIAKQFVSVEQLNRIIDTWRYGPLDKANKPVRISVSFGDRVKQNARRTWCLLRLLPLMIGSFVPNDNVHWHFLLELKDIVEMAFAFKLSQGHLMSLTVKIQDHLAAFRDLFPSKKLLPKHHFMLHYERLFSVLGLLCNAWCMRFESKHLYFTKLVKVVNNFKNVCSTLAMRHQLMQAYHLSCESGFKINDIKLSKAVDVEMESLSPLLCEMLVQKGVSRDKSLYMCRSVTMNGISCHKHMYVV